MDFVVTSLLK
jgi:hypothetical protein